MDVSTYLLVGVVISAITLWTLGGGIPRGSHEWVVALLIVFMISVAWPGFLVLTLFVGPTRNHSGCSKNT